MITYYTYQSNPILVDIEFGIPMWTVDILIGSKGKCKPVGVWFGSQLEAACAGYDICLSICRRAEDYQRQRMEQSP